MILIITHTFLVRLIHKAQNILGERKARGQRPQPRLHHRIMQTKPPFFPLDIGKRPSDTLCIES